MRSHHHCQDFARATDLRPVEPGMPVPAGTGMTRRQVLSRALGTAVAVYGAGRLLPDVLDAGIAHAASGPGDRVLISVFLPGGADALSVLAPVGDPAYRRLRPRLALPPGAGRPFGEDPRLQWHPSAAPLADLHAEGKVSVLPAIGYAGPDQSHFTSRHFYEVGALDAGLRTGWLGRLLDVVGTPDNPLQGLALDARLSPALAAARVPVAAVPSAQDVELWADQVWGDVADAMIDAVADVGAGHASSRDAALRDVAGTAVHGHRLRAQLLPFKPDKGVDPAVALGTPVAYPDPKDRFSQRLATLAAMLGAGLPLRCVALDAAGEYDTHDAQADDLTEDLRVTCGALHAFQRDLEARGLADRVLVHVWSEFGRRAAENGSAGTDHGAAGLGLVIGTRAAGRMVGEFPGLARLDKDGNVRATSDFRGLYASLAESWMGVDAAAVLPGAARLPRYGVVR